MERHVTLAPNSTKLATVSADKTVKVWAIPSGDLIGDATLPLSAT